MYRKEMLKRAILIACAVLAIAICVAVITFFVHTVRLRNEFRMERMRINDVMRASDLDRCSLSHGGETIPLTRQALTYYNMYLNSSYTMVFNRKMTQPTEQSITLTLEGGTLTLTGLEDGTAVGILWQTPSQTCCYTVRNEAQTFMQLESYFKTCKQKASAD